MTKITRDIINTTIISTGNWIIPDEIQEYEIPKSVLCTTNENEYKNSQFQ